MKVISLPSLVTALDISLFTEYYNNFESLPVLTEHLK